MTLMTLLSLVFGCLVVCVVSSPTRRQFVPETSSFGPAVVTSDGDGWDDSSDEFDLDGDEDWLGDSILASPSSRPDYEDYDDADSSSKRIAEDDDVEVQEAEEEEDEGTLQDRRNSAEFLFLPSTDRRLMLQDDDADQSGLIKVRHTGKNSYTEVESNSLEEGSQKDEEDESDDQFEFTMGDDDEKDEALLQKDEALLQKDEAALLQKDDFVLEEDDTRSSKDQDLEKGDFVLEEEDTRSNKDMEEDIPRPVTRDDDDDDNAEGDDDDDDDQDEGVFESPEEDSQVIYGDHVFLY